jgi:hypothetical protein
MGQKENEKFVQNAGKILIGTNRSLGIPRCRCVEGGAVGPPTGGGVQGKAKLML